MLEATPKTIVLSIFLALVGRALLRSFINYRKLAGIPTIGPPGFFSSYLGALHAVKHSKEMVQEGYEKYNGRPFKIAQINRWMVVFGSPDMVEEFRGIPDEYISFKQAAAEMMHTKYTIGDDLAEDDVMIDTVKGPLTRNIKAKFGELYEEVEASFKDYIPATKDWVEVPFTDTIRRVVCRVSNRLFVGLPLCRDPEYMDLNINFTIELMVTALLLNIVPAFVEPFVAKFFSKVPGSIRKGIRLIGPLFEERLAKEATEGPNWNGKPNDLISWTIDMSKDKPDKTISEYVRIMMMVNFAAIHTSSASVTTMAYNLAAYPEYVPALREEVEEVIRVEGWTKAAMLKMRKLDSFMKESARVYNLSAMSPNRKVAKEYTFANGVTLPKGTNVSIAAQAIHDDEKIWPNAKEFDGLRFFKIYESQKDKIANQHMVTLGDGYSVFGHGRHACPGRFFAVNELKLMLAYMLITYDVKFANDRRSPPPRMAHGASSSPSRTEHVFFRARA